MTRSRPTDSLAPPAEPSAARGVFGGAQPIERLEFSTDGLAPQERHSAYRDLVAIAFEAHDPSPDFSAHVVSWRLDRMVLHDSQVSAQVFDRPPSRAAQDGLDHFVLQLGLSGAVAGDFEDRLVEAAPGEIIMADLSRSFRRLLTPGHVITLGIARDILESIAPGGDLHGRRLDGASARLLTDFLVILTRRLPDLTTAALPGIRQTVVGLLAGCLASGAHPEGRSHSDNEALAFTRAKRFIEANLGSRELGPETVAIAAKLSRSALYRLFEQVGGVSQFIWSRRLSRVRTALADPGAPPRISDIAYRWGFTSEAHFSRAFRRAYGSSPRDFIAEARRQNGLHEQTMGSPDLRRFNEWVQGLG